jgi:glycosyltransferase involved in cell wall biosynthesis
LPNVHWVYFDLPRWARFWKKGQRGVHLYYYLWQVGAYSVARRLQRDVGFDIIHHVTFVNYWIPSFLALLDVPLVWGPVGGGESAPKSFYKTFYMRGKIYEYMRDLARYLGEHDPFVRFTARRSRIILATSSETASRLQRLSCNRLEVMPQVALPQSEIKSLSELPLHRSNSFRMMSIGRLLHLKGFHLGLEAFAKCQQEFSASEYWLIGEGPELRNLERLAARLGVSEKVVFWGALPREQVFEKLAESDVLVHPSLHESGGWVCLEAMAAGRPVLCLDLGGPSLQVIDETGFKIPARIPEQTIEEMAKAMLKLARDSNLRRRMGDAARQRVREQFSWDEKGKSISELYEKVVARCLD